MTDIPSLDDLYDKYPEVMGERPPIVICSGNLFKKSKEELKKTDDSPQ